MFSLLPRAICLSSLCAFPALAQEIVPSLRFSAIELTALQADLDNGSTIYDHACVACHGETGQGETGQGGQGGGPALTGNLNLSQVMLVVSDGRNTMPAFNVFTDQQLVDISTFVVERLKQ